MIFSQVTLQVETTVKKKNGAEANVIKPIVLPAVKQRISQLRLDEFSMNANKILSVRKLITGLNFEECKKLANNVLHFILL